ncbi:hypothetical protein [Pseudonocardia asaccharolytica]|uniref:Uncharacterized protein n=1 Tax=Pseudonocardia asaccharolytica DSM 44247 = NBRC 16224 TaxID=1123024 RepID=A0A511D4C3_9PSEU|nr:hypothetical protein [Pseudonocardia asaccharolytica]GEL17758.1 hypothetical protein PA7_15950 [Pseudonocardia asaccharolytica DSM 44247 = NBRC 16224]
MHWSATAAGIHARLADERPAVDVRLQRSSTAPVLLGGTARDEEVAKLTHWRGCADASARPEA